MLERESQRSAGTLLYESAKQCLNAVANRRGHNPVYTREKMQYLRVIGMLYPDVQATLEDGWRAAMDLHIHADQGRLAEDEFQETGISPNRFIDAMIEIYQEEAP